MALLRRFVVLSSFVALLGTACGDDRAAQGEDCVSTDSTSECEPGLVCAAKSATQLDQLTCQTQCTGEGGLGCKAGEVCTKTETGMGTFVCRTP